MSSFPAAKVDFSTTTFSNPTAMTNVSTSVVADGPETESERENLPHKLVKSQFDLLFSGEHSDCSVRCNGIEWAVHRGTLSQRSIWFKKALGNFVEGKTGIVKMDDDDPHAIEGLLMYLYTLEYPDWSCSESDKRGYKSTVPGAKWQTHLALFKLADKIVLKRLKRLAKWRLASTMHEEWAMGNVHELLDELWNMAQPSTEELKVDALKVVSAHASDLFVKSQFRDLISGGRPFVSDLFQQLIKEPTKLRKEFMDAREEENRHRTALGSALELWSYGERSNIRNKARVADVLRDWDSDWEGE